MPADPIVPQEITRWECSECGAEVLRDHHPGCSYGEMREIPGGRARLGVLPFETVPVRYVRWPVQVTDDLVEKAAKAQWDNLCARLRDRFPDYQGWAKFGELDDQRREDWLADTRVALIAALAALNGDAPDSDHTPRQGRA